MATWRIHPPMVKAPILTNVDEERPYIKLPLLLINKRINNKVIRNMQTLRAAIYLVRRTLLWVPTFRFDAFCLTFFVWQEPDRVRI
jgi:hypothetical protein